MSQQDQVEPRILVADDDQSIRQLLATIIRREHMTVDLAEDGFEAIERLKQTNYSVILLDLMMPRVDGFGVIEYLKQSPPPQKPVIIVITAYADQKFKHVDPDMVAGILRKPFEIAEVGSLVRLCVQGIRAAAQQPSAVDGDETVRVLSSSNFAELEEIRKADVTDVN